MNRKTEKPREGGRRGGGRTVASRKAAEYWLSDKASSQRHTSATLQVRTLSGKGFALTYCNRNNEGVERVLSGCDVVSVYISLRCSRLESSFIHSFICSFIHSFIVPRTLLISFSAFSEAASSAFFFWMLCSTKSPAPISSRFTLGRLAAAAAAAEDAAASVVVKGSW